MKSKKLYRVDINLKYLSLQNKPPTITDVINWANHAHSGEFDGGVKILEVSDISEIEDFEDDYALYENNEECDDQYLKEDAVRMLMLDLEVVRKRLSAAGYKIVKN